MAIFGGGADMVDGAGERALLVGERDVAQAERDDLVAQMDALKGYRDGLEQERLRLESSATRAQEALAVFKRTRRYRLAQMLAGPLDRLSGMFRS